LDKLKKLKEKLVGLPLEVLGDEGYFEDEDDFEDEGE
jgi:hypothetical protein